MPASPEKITAYLLVAESLVYWPPLAPNAPVSRYTAFINAFPDVPDQIVSCTSNGLNRNDGRLMEGSPIHHHGIQVRVRAKNQDDAYSKIKAIWDLCNSVKRRSLTVLTETYRIDNLSCQPILFLGVGPDDQRPSFVFDLYSSIKMIGA